MTNANKYGEDGAFNLALNARHLALQGLKGSFDPGPLRSSGNPRRDRSGA